MSNPFVKKLEIYIPEENLSEVTEILHKHGVGGVSLSEIKGRGKLPHEPVPETVRFYMTSKKIVPEYVSRHKIESIVSESSTKPIIDDLFQLKPARAKVFVYDILEAYDLVSKASGEDALT
ncbi:MAG: P-II family nitrogen regulator [Nitrososphaeraceae archaeon]